YRVPDAFPGLQVELFFGQEPCSASNGVETLLLKGSQNTILRSFHNSAGAASERDRFKIFTGTNPSRLYPVQNITASAFDSQSVTLSWNSPGGLTAGHRVIWATGNFAPASCNGGTDVGMATSYTFTGLNPATQYSFRICTYDALGTVSPGHVFQKT